MIVRMFASAGPNSYNFRAYMVHHGEFPFKVNECDAYVISGSAKSVYDSDGWIKRLLDLIREFDESRTRTFGICFGHQCIAQALGGQVSKSMLGWGVGTHKYSIESPAAFPTVSDEDVRLLCSHQDQVERLPEGAILTLRSEFCPNAGMSIGNHMLSMQPHPEFDQEYAKALMNMRRYVLGQLYEKGIDSLSIPTNKIAVVQSIVKFLEN